jgi:gamma-glutamyltranspeptidase/glutathione hydrolase
MNGKLLLEEGLPPGVADGLAARGHRLGPSVSGSSRSMFGRGQVIVRQADGVLWGGSDPRADGCAMGY